MSDEVSADSEKPAFFDKLFPDHKGLVLTRRLGEMIVIEHGLLVIEVIKIKGKQIKLKFYGKVQVDRGEKFESELKLREAAGGE